MLLGNLLVQNSARKKLFSSVSAIPSNKVGLVLGTVKILKNGRINLYFKYRVQAAYDLYKSGKVEYLLISGGQWKSGLRRTYRF